MKRLAGALAIASLAVIGVGCGNDEQNDYVDEVNRLQTELVDEVTAAVSGAVPTNQQDAAEIAAELEQVFADGAEQFESVSPPEEVADLHEQLVKQIDGIAEQVGAAEEAFTSGNATEASQAALALQEASNRIQTDLNGLIDQINSELQN
jgi:hypothetical protein